MTNEDKSTDTTEPQVPAPDKHEPHSFEPIPDQPIVYPQTGIAFQQGLPGQGTGLGNSHTSKCMLCGQMQSDPIHIPADTEVAERWPV